MDIDQLKEKADSVNLLRKSEFDKVISEIDILVYSISKSLQKPLKDVIAGLELNYKPIKFESILSRLQDNFITDFPIKDVNSNSLIDSLKTAIELLEKKKEDLYYFSMKLTFANKAHIEVSSLNLDPDSDLFKNHLKIYTEVRDFFGVEKFNDMYLKSKNSKLTLEHYSSFLEKIYCGNMVLEGFTKFFGAIEILLSTKTFLGFHSFKISLIDQNPYPEIFTNTSSFLFFKYLFEKDLFSTECLDISFLFEEMKLHGLLVESLKGNIYQEWAMKYHNSYFQRLKNSTGQVLLKRKGVFGLAKKDFFGD